MPPHASTHTDMHTQTRRTKHHTTTHTHPHVPKSPPNHTIGEEVDLGTLPVVLVLAGEALGPVLLQHGRDAAWLFWLCLLWVGVGFGRIRERDAGRWWRRMDQIKHTPTHTHHTTPANLGEHGLDGRAHAHGAGPLHGRHPALHQGADDAGDVGAFRVCVCVCVVKGLCWGFTFQGFFRGVKGGCRGFDDWGLSGFCVFVGWWCVVVKAFFLHLFLCSWGMSGLI